MMKWWVLGDEKSREQWKSHALATTADNEILEFMKSWWGEESEIVVQTSGSTGEPTRIHLPKSFMKESALATARYFDLSEGDRALMALPVKYIGGKMMIVRADVNNWQLDIIYPKSCPEIPNKQYDFLSLTPMQCSLMLEKNKHALDKVTRVLLGGSEVGTDLLETIRELKTEFYLGFGMTETSSHVAIRRLNGENTSKVYTATSAFRFSNNTSQQLIIHHNSSGKKWVTNDIIELLSEREFLWKGRLDNVINSGGIKIHPEQLEKQLSASINFPFYLSSIKDAVLGGKLVLIAEGEGSAEKRELLNRAIQQLEPHFRPKEIFFRNKLHRTENGKILRVK